MIFFIKEEENENVFFSLEFSEDIKLKIEDSDRDLVYLTFSDLKSYIEKDVQVPWSIKTKKLDNYSSLVTLTLLPVALLIASKDLSKGISKEEALKTTAVLTKLNYIIENTNNNSSSSKYLYLMFGIGIVLITIILSLPKIINFFFPANIFLIGKQIDVYNKRLDLRSKIIWGVIVALVVSIVAGIFLTKLPS